MNCPVSQALKAVPMSLTVGDLALEPLVQLAPRIEEPTGRPRVRVPMVGDTTPSAST